MSSPLYSEIGNDGPAIFRAFEDTLALQQVWVFILAPVIGAVIAGFLWKYLKPAVSE